jgi:hypothetical protein
LGAVAVFEATLNQNATKSVELSGQRRGQEVELRGLREQESKLTGQLAELAGDACSLPWVCAWKLLHKHALRGSWVSFKKEETAACDTLHLTLSPPPHHHPHPLCTCVCCSLCKRAPVMADPVRDHPGGRHRGGHCLSERVVPGVPRGLDPLV